MKITVFGAGAVGGHVAARLGAGAEAAGIEVSAVGRGAQLDAIRERGVTLWIGDERYDARIHATDRPEELGVQDVVIVALKSSTLPQAAPAIAPLLGPASSVVFAMNGIPWWYLYHCPENGLKRPDLSRLDPDGVLAQTIGLERVIGCMIASANMVVEPGVIRNSGAPATVSRWASRTAANSAGSGRSRKRSSAPVSALRSAPRSATKSGKNCCATSAPARSAR